MAVGEISRDGFNYLAVKGLTKTNTAVSKGAVVIFNTDGWITAGDAAVGPHGVALNTQTATAATQKELIVLLRGCVHIAKHAEDQFQGQALKWDGTDMAKLVEGVDTFMSNVGMALSTALTAVAEVEVLLSQ